MNYPVWDLPMGGGVLIAVVAILHVFVSHFAVGGGLWLVLTEHLARRRQSGELLEFVRRLSKFFLLVTLVLGAITGVGIWFTIGLVSPDAVSALIHTFLWGWAIEWTLFVIEIAAALVYWYGWDRLDQRTHLAVGWIYFLAAWLSLVVINGIVTFMLTPGRWLETQAFWDGFFNPTYWPSLAVRTCLSLAQAGVLLLLATAALPRGKSRAWLARYSAAWVAASVVLGGLSCLWYRAEFPGWSEATLGALPILPIVSRLLVLGLAAMLVLALWPLLQPRTWNAAGATLLVIAGLLAFGAGEWIREAGRKPFTIPGYLYSTGLRVADEGQLAADGVLRHTKWIDVRAAGAVDSLGLGQDLYRAHCQVCHTMNGYNGLQRFLRHWNGATIRGLLPRLHHLRGRMPAWHGDNAETELLAQHLESASRPGAAWPTDPDAARRLAWDLSCGLCHTADGYRPLRASLAGMSRDELDGQLEMLPEMSEAMPAYTGGDRERELLLDHLGELAASPGRASAAAAAKGRSGS